MVIRFGFRPMWVAALAVAVGFWSTSAYAEDKTGTKDADTEVAEAVEFFAAIESGDIDVKLIPKDSKQSTILIENKLDKPVRIKLPESFAGVPVLKQMAGGMGAGGMGGMGGGMGGMGGGMGGMGGGGGQGFGGGMGGMGGGMGGMGGGMGGMGGGMGGMGGFFNVKPGKVAKLRVPTVCLEHGKPEPTPRMAYKIVPLESFTKKPEVIELCKMLGTGKIPQNAAQAAAWHFTDSLSWEQLAQKIGVDHLIGPSEMYFSPQEIQVGMRLASEAMQRASETLVKGEKSDSLSQQ